MMKILVLGSINIDYNYSVGHITTPKETQASSYLEVCPGGKGLNQAVTLARAGLEVHLAGLVGSDATKMLEQMRERLIHKANAAYLLGPDEQNRQTTERQREEK